MKKCECTYDPDFRRALSARRGDPVDGRCHMLAADHSPVVASPALCLGCLHGCAE